MPSFIIVEKTGIVKCTTSKTLNVSDLYKKCNFKSSEGFNCAHTWSIEFNNVEYKIKIFGKIDGKAGSENKYEFPPPIENILFFGSCAIINTQDDKIIDMNATEFKDIMDYLQGGYSDLGDDDEEEEEDEDEDDGKCKTKQGYVKDDFVVDDDEDDCSSEEPIPPKKTKKPAKSSAETIIMPAIKDKISIIKKIPVKPKIIKPVVVVQELVECSDELEEDQYV